MWGPSMISVRRHGLFCAFVYGACLTGHSHWSAGCPYTGTANPRQVAVSALKFTDLQFELVYDFDGNLLPRNVMDPHPDLAEPPLPYGLPYAVPWQPICGSCLSSCLSRSYWTARVTNRMPYSPCSLSESMTIVSLILQLTTAVVSQVIPL